MISSKKNMILVFGFITLLFFSYKFAIHKTIYQKKAYTNLNEQQISAKELPRKLSILKKRQIYYDSLLNGYHLGNTSFQNKLLSFITSYTQKNNMMVINFSEPHLTNSLEGLVLKTYIFTVEGKFDNIQDLIYTIEQKTKYGEIINITFDKRKNIKTRKEYLQATILLRSYS